MFRVQVKSTSNKSADSDGYKCHVRQPRRPRNRFEVLEFLAVYVIPEDVWYIIPYAQLADKRCINLNPRSQRNAYRQFRDAWDLLVAESPSDVRRRRKQEQLAQARRNARKRLAVTVASEFGPLTGQRAARSSFTVGVSNRRTRDPSTRVSRAGKSAREPSLARDDIGEKNQNGSKS
jgi:hypothetical protein